MNNPPSLHSICQNSVGSVLFLLRHGSLVVKAIPAKFPSPPRKLALESSTIHDTGPRISVTGTCFIQNHIPSSPISLQASHPTSYPQDRGSEHSVAPDLP